MSASRAVLVFVGLSLFCIPPAFAAEDMPGATDFEGLPRVENTSIAGYQQSEFDAGGFVTGVGERKRSELIAPEGKRTRILYLGRETQTPLQMLRNYQRAFAGFGEYQPVYECQGKACDPYLTRNVVWSKSNQIKTSFRNPYALYNLANSFRDPMYAYGTVTRGDKLFHVSVFTTFLLGGQTGLKNLPVVHLEVLEVENFEPNLVFIDADEITSQIAESGTVSLYGIQFEFDSAALTRSSDATIAEVAKVLKSDPALSIYVVGHTDNAGTLQYNQQLSGNRAGSVVSALIGDHGIDAARLEGVGVGPVAPLASNESDKGRKLNRRVAIVRQ